MSTSSKSEECVDFVLQVDCKALVSAETFKDQNYYDILINLLPELASQDPGHLHSHM